MKAPLTAWIEDGALRVEGERIDPSTGIPHRLRGRIGYLPTGTTGAELEGLMRAGDRAYRSREGDLGGVKLAVGDGYLHLVPCAAWGIEGWTPDAVAAELGHLVAAVESEGWSWAYTVASLAGRICREHVPELRQLPPAYRWLAHTATVGGPCLALRGGAPMAYEVDIRGAYLATLDMPVPVPGTWAPSVGLGWDDLFAEEGLIEARVLVPRECWEVPPLPLRWPGLVAWPTGQFSTVTTIPYLRWCEARFGVEVLEVLQAAVCRARPIHAPAAARIRAIGDDGLRKRVYTRYWGRLASLGGFEGTIEPDDGAEESGAGPMPRATVQRAAPKRRPGSSLWWRWAGRGGDAPCPPDYLPCSAAYISTHATQALHLGLAGLAPGSICMAHVDAVWTTDGEGARALEGAGGWKVKNAGPLAVYGVGMAHHGDSLLAAGYRADHHGPLTPESLREHASGAEAAWGTRLARVWHDPLWRPGEGTTADGRPLPLVHNPRAESVAVHVEETRRNAAKGSPSEAPMGWSVEEKRWNKRGWPLTPA